MAKYDLATKEDLVAATTRLGLEFDKKLNDLRQEVAVGFDRVNTTLDAIYKEVVAGNVQNLRMDKTEKVLESESL